MFNNWLRGALSVAMIVGFAGYASAVGLAGNYHETNGIIINIPQNQPLVDCDIAADNARCHSKKQAYFGQGATKASAPAAGVMGATSIVGDPRTVGAPFEMPVGMMGQTKTQDAVVLGNVAIYLVTSFMAEAPGTERADYGGGANADTRQFAQRAFSVGNLNAHGQNNGLAVFSKQEHLG